MATKRLLLNEDPRWLPFVKRYATDCYRFAVEVVGVRPSHQQHVMMNLVSEAGSRVSVSSGHGTGKSFSLSVITLWHILCYYQSWLLITANTYDQIKASTLKELAKHIGMIKRGQHGWIAEHLELMAEGTLRIKGYEESWKMETAVANRKNANKMAGRHAQWLMIIADEASTIPDEVMTTLRGALTESGNRMLLTSQPTHNSGFFYNTHNAWSRANSGPWHNLVFSSFDSPWTSKDALKLLWDSYDDDERRVRLLGLFPQDSSKFFVGRRDVERCYKLGEIIKPDESWGWIITSDIASGEGLRDKSAVTIARVSGYGDQRKVEVVEVPLFTNNIRSNQFANYIADAASSKDNITYMVDSGGLGINVCQDLEDMGKNIVRINWGNPCFRKINQDRYLNLRAQATHQMARAMKEGRLSIRTDAFKQILIDQASYIPKTFTDKGRIRVPPKHGPEWEGRGSPDLCDTIAFCFLETASYVVSSDTIGKSGATATESALSAVNDAFAGFE